MRGGSLGYRSRVAEALDIEPTRITLLKSPYFLVKQTYSNGQTWSLHKDEINLPMIGHFPTKRLAKQAVSDPEALKYYEETLNKDFRSYGTLQKLGVPPTEAKNLVTEINPSPYFIPWLKSRYG